MYLLTVCFNLFFVCCAIASFDSTVCQSEDGGVCKSDGQPCGGVYIGGLCSINHSGSVWGQPLYNKCCLPKKFYPPAFTGENLHELADAILDFFRSKGFLISRENCMDPESQNCSFFLGGLNKATVLGFINLATATNYAADASTYVATAPEDIVSETATATEHEVLSTEGMTSKASAMDPNSSWDYYRSTDSNFQLPIVIDKGTEKSHTTKIGFSSSIKRTPQNGYFLTVSGSRKLTAYIKSNYQTIRMNDAVMYKTEKGDIFHESDPSRHEWQLLFMVHL